MTDPNDDLAQYQSGRADWRGTIRANNRRTMFVIFMFFVIYTGVGLLIDMFMATGHYPHTDLSVIFYALVTFQITPTATLIMLVIAGISLLISYSMYDRLMLMGTEYREITPETISNNRDQQLYNVVEEMKVAAGLRYMPKVYIIDADYMNAFASGYSERSAMVAITRGLIEKLNRDELQAVMAHEISHINHMDIKLTLTASLLANLALMVLDMLFYNVIFSRGNGNGENRGRNQLAMIIMLLRYLLPVINVLLLLYLSRSRELSADAGCVQLMRNNEPLAKALIKISGDHQQNRDQYSYQYSQTPHENVRREAYIFDPIQAGIETTSSISDLFSTHPSLETRLRALGFIKK